MYVNVVLAEWLTVFKRELMCVCQPAFGARQFQWHGEVGKAVAGVADDAQLPHRGRTGRADGSTSFPVSAAIHSAAVG